MPRYFFNLHGDTTTVDHEGVDLPSEDAAHERAVLETRTMVAQSALYGRISLDHRVDVTDGGGVLIESIRVSDALRIEAPEDATVDREIAPQERPFVFEPR